MNPLLQARERLGLTQQEVASRTGTSQQYIQRLEAGQISACPPLIATFYDSELSGNLTKEYADWVHEERQQLPDLSHFFEQMKAEAAKHLVPYLSGAEMFRWLAIRLIGAEAYEDNATKRVAEVLHVHPVIVLRWRQHGGTPPTLVRALKETAK